MKLTTLRTAFALLALLAIGSCASAPPTTLDESLDLIHERALRSHVRWLADDKRAGRMTGEPGYDASAQYVAEQFARMGLEPGGVDGWYQQVPLRTYKAVGDTAEFVIHADSGDLEFTYRDDFSVAGDPLDPSTRLRAEVVYVGYGIHAPELGYSDYDNIDVSGKIIAGYSGAPEHFEGVKRAYYSSSTTKREEAVRRGAIGTISLRSRKAEERSPWEEMKERIGIRPSMTWINGAGAVARHFPSLRSHCQLQNQRRSDFPQNG